MPTNIFHIWESINDYNETQVYGKQNVDIDWGIFSKVAEGKAEYKPLQIKMRTNKILKKDLIGAPGCNCLISKKALEIIGLDAFRDCISFPLTINDAPYFAMLILKSVDCLDKENSPHTYLNIGDVEFGFWEIQKHQFHLDRLKANTVFTLPQTDRLIYCTGDIGRKILESDLSIMAQPLLTEEVDIRTNRVQYNNPFLGISFEEPLNFKLACKQYEKLQQGKKLTAKAWENKIPPVAKDEYVLELSQFELLKSNGWFQKGELFIYISAKKPEEIFAERKCVEKENIRPDFDCRIYEYGFQTTCIASFKDGLSYVVIIVHRNDDVTLKYYEKTKNFFRAIKFNS